MIRVRISLLKVMTMPPATVNIPFALWEGSWHLRDKPICRMPKPRRMMPTARMSEKIKSERLLTTVRGSSAANAVTEKLKTNTMAAKIENRRYARLVVLLLNLFKLFYTPSSLFGSTEINSGLPV